jgi:hypothetical protein
VAFPGGFRAWWWAFIAIPATIDRVQPSVGRGAFAVDLRDDDSQDMVQKKLAAELNPNRNADPVTVRISEGLFTPSNDRAPPITPESRKLKLKQALIKMIETRSKSAPTVVCIEDLHWADPSTADLFRNLLNEAALVESLLQSVRVPLCFRHSSPTDWGVEFV